MLTDGIKIPLTDKNPNPTMVIALKISKFLPGNDDQKWRLSLTINTLN
jgi:hypothetical protein